MFIHAYILYTPHLLKIPLVYILSCHVQYTLLQGGSALPSTSLSPPRGPRYEDKYTRNSSYSDQCQDTAEILEKTDYIMLEGGLLAHIVQRMKINQVNINMAYRHILCILDIMYHDAVSAVLLERSDLHEWFMASMCTLCPTLFRHSWIGPIILKVGQLGYESLHF